MMIKQVRRKFFAVAFLCLAVPGFLSAQQSSPAAQPSSAEPDTYDTWIRKRVETVGQIAPQGAVAQNGNGVSNQVEAPSVDQASTSLVDTSSASDFVSMALSLSGISAKSEDNSTPMSGSVTATLYSLIAAAKGVPITDPAFYKAGAKYRRLAFTIGSEKSTMAEDFTDKPSTNVGLKVLVINYRDIYSSKGQNELKGMETSVADLVKLEQKETDRIQCLIFQAVHPGGVCDVNGKDFQNFFATEIVPSGWPATRKKIEDNPSAMTKIDSLIATLAAGRQVTSDEILRRVEEIQKAQQLSVAAYTKQRDGDGTDEYRAELIYDHGLSERMNWTVNAGFDYLDRKTSQDSRDARIATEFQAKLSNPGGGAWKARPVTLSASGEATRGTESTWLVQAQVKLLVPITTGVDLPIAYTYANRSANGITAGSRLKISLSVDPVRFREWLTSSAGQRNGNQ